MLRTKKTFVEEFEDVSLTVSEALTLALWQLNVIDSNPDTADVADRAQALVAEMTFAITNDADNGTSHMDVYSVSTDAAEQTLEFTFDWKVDSGRLVCLFFQEGTDDAVSCLSVGVSDVTEILGSFDKGNA